MIVAGSRDVGREGGNFGKRVIYELRVERAPSREENILVAEGAMMGTASETTIS